MKKLVIVIMATLLLVACGDDSSSYATVKGAKVVDKHSGGRAYPDYITIEVNGSKYKLEVTVQNFKFVEKDTIVDVTYDVARKKVTKIMIPSKGGMRNE